MDPNKGTNFDALSGEWFIEQQAECMDSLDTMEELFDESTDGSDISNLIDNDEVDFTQPLALYNSQLTEECDKAILELKRKYISPERTLAELSPRLEAVTISPPKRQSKRRLFEDSGIENDEATDNSEQVQGESRSSKDGAALLNLEIMNANSVRTYILGKFKEKHGVSYTEITRTFKSDKTCTNNWVAFIVHINDEVAQSTKIIFQQQCEFMFIMDCEMTALFLFEFKAAKSRETLLNMFKNVNVNSCQIISDPPRIRSAPAAFFFYQKILKGTYFYYGSTPDWIAKHTIVAHNMGTAESFDLSEMIQWCWDNNLSEDHEIAYKYAMEAGTNSNATAFLRSNQQVKFVKDCVHMLRLYRRHEMRQMTMSQWIQKCCKDVQGMGNWKTIAGFLRFQQINVVSFLTCMRAWLKCIPKKNCMLIYGKPDTGKSYFIYSLLHFMKGQVVSFMNKASQFWLQPLQDCKMGYIDDATYACWQHFDVYMRAALDGNKVSIDVKHKAPSQMKLPPLMISSNINIHAEPTLMYLHSRISGFEFPNKMPVNDMGEPEYKITDQDWKSFFTKLALQLDLTFEEEDESNGADETFRCSAGRPAESI